MLWSAVDSLGIYFWFDINLKEVSHTPPLNFFRVLCYQRWRNGKLPKLCLLPATLAFGPLLLLFLRQEARCLTIHWARTNLWTYEWTFHNFFVDLPWTKTAGVERKPLSWTLNYRISIKILSIPQEQKGSERRNLPKDGEFKTQPVEKKFEVNKYSKINQFQHQEIAW